MLEIQSKGNVGKYDFKIIDRNVSTSTGSTESEATLKSTVERKDAAQVHSNTTNFNQQAITHTNNSNDQVFLQEQTWPKNTENADLFDKSTIETVQVDTDDEYNLNYDEFQHVTQRRKVKKQRSCCGKQISRKR